MTPATGLVYEARAVNAPALAIECRALVKHFGEVKAVDGIDLRVELGQCHGLLGPNGAGKTTTVEILEGLSKPTRGEVSILGQHWGERGDDALRQRLGVALQETQLSEFLTVRETIRLFRSFYHRGRSVDDAIAQMSLEEKRDARVGKLSGGQRQRLALACALVGRPDLLFLDEPTTGLDPQARLKIWEVIETFKRDGGTVILTTHYMEEAARLCDRISIIDAGKIIAEDTPRALIASLGASQIVEFDTSAEVDVARISRLPGVGGHHRKAATHVLTVTDLAPMLPALLAELAEQGVRLERMTTHEPTLEDVFVSLTGKALRDG